MLSPTSIEVIQILVARIPARGWLMKSNKHCSMRQFSVMVKRGMSAADAIKAATSVAADHMGWQTDVGALEVGRYGDLIAVRGNPLENVSVLESVKVVVKGGLIFKLPE